MSIIYVPRLIESAEQAEALPVGTVAHRPDEVNEDYVLVASKFEDDGAWQRPDLIDDLGWDEDMVGWTALVPIEAEEEYSTERAGLAWDNDAIYSSPEDVRRDGWTDPLQRRYVTPWESA